MDPFVYVFHDWCRKIVDEYPFIDHTELHKKIKANYFKYYFYNHPQMGVNVQYGGMFDTEQFRTVYKDNEYKFIVWKDGLNTIVTIPSYSVKNKVCVTGEIYPDSKQIIIDAINGRNDCAKPLLVNHIGTNLLKVMIGFLETNKKSLKINRID
jgi:hypothetical protein